MRAIASEPATAPKKRAVNLTLNVDLVTQQQQAADACVEYWNEVLAAEGSFANECSVLSKAGAGEK